MPRGARRGGPTRHELIELQDLCPGEAQVRGTASKQALCEDLLRRLRNAQPQNELPVGRPEGEVPAGWGNIVAVADRVVVQKHLLRKVRGELEDMPKDAQLGLLLGEQKAVVAAERNNHAPTLQFARESLQEMAANPAPLPANATDEWVWYLYKTALAKKTDEISASAAATVRPRVRFAPATPKRTQH